jgi:hypothetical protein
MEYSIKKKLFQNAHLESGSLFAGVQTKVVQNDVNNVNNF